jgi:hypothetical protein
VRMVSALVVSLLAVLLAAGQSQTQPPEPIRLPPGSAVTIAPGQTTTVLCEAGLSRCVCTYNRRPGEFSYELVGPHRLSRAMPKDHNGNHMGGTAQPRRDRFSGR